jgi:hypothetical protein
MTLSRRCFGTLKCSASKTEAIMTEKVISKSRATGQETHISAAVSFRNIFTYTLVIGSGSNGEMSSSRLVQSCVVMLMHWETKITHVRIVRPF